MREELGYGRLGRYVLEEMAESLTVEGLGWFPAWRLSPKENDEPRKDQELWVYVRDGGRRSQLIGAVQNSDDCDVPAVLGLLDGRPHDLSAKAKLDLIREILGPDRPGHHSLVQGVFGRRSREGTSGSRSDR
ncbi:hypothetical protein [Kitasatospora herbaricolor]|uniref:Uncharacterized protein n=1 Tax=Kitasatospora herbaricolor TaxID=68217 RepID=A0ABZ1WJ60_9ACTN|nr:hypothetical protein [Kitasatospora herbaricolor]